MTEQGTNAKVIVITGASSGFGRGAALELAKRGMSIVLAARRGELLADLSRRCEQAGGRALAVPTDVSKAEEVERLAQAALGAFGRIDVWINNAGVAALGRFERVPLSDHAQVIATDLLGTLYGSHHAYRHFAERGAGVLINVASELGQHSIPYYASYTASKHGVVGLTEAIRQEADQSGLRDLHVCLVMPTAHDTPFFDHVANYSGHEVQAPKPLHDPQNVVDTLVRLVDDPTDSEIVGGDGVVKILMKKLLPGLEEKVAAKQIHRIQMEQAPAAPSSPGAVHRPVPQGTEVSAGRREAA